MYKNLPNIKDLIKECKMLDDPAKNLGHIDIAMSAFSYIELQAKRTAFVHKIEKLRDYIKTEATSSNKDQGIEILDKWIKSMRTNWDPLLDFL